MESLRLPKAGELYRHYKGNTYKVLGMGVVSAYVPNYILGKLEQTMETCKIQVEGSLCNVVLKTQDSFHELKHTPLVVYRNADFEDMVWVRTLEEWCKPVENMNRFSLLEV
jgi:hypothetical protein